MGRYSRRAEASSEKKKSEETRRTVQRKEKS